jgi:hypothetical protein
MSAPRPGTLAPIIAPFMCSLITIDRLSPNNLAHLLQRGVSAIVHSFSMAYLCTGHKDTALASAQVTADRFQQFVVQATIEKLDTSLLSEAFGFALRGTTYSRVLDDVPTLTAKQTGLLFSVHQDYQRFVDALHRLVDKAQSELSEPMAAFAETVAQGRI